MKQQKTTCNEYTSIKQMLVVFYVESLSIQIKLESFGKNPLVIVVK